MQFKTSGNASTYTQVSEITASFKKKTPMKVFSWTAPNNEIDTC